MHIHEILRDATTISGGTVPRMPLQGWWHELNCRDVSQAMNFYGRVMGWQFEETVLADGSAYHIAQVAGRPVCGLFRIEPQRHGDVPDHWMTYADVADLDAALQAARMAGGDVLRAPLTVPGLGRLALLADAAGAIIGVCEKARTNTGETAEGESLVTGPRE